MQYAHSLGIVHRDVKPSNIMIRPDGSPCVMDFGLAKRDAGEITMTIDGQILGTPAYMSPEQSRGEGHLVDGRSDVYSLGVILYQLLTGELPFRGNKAMMLHQVQHDEPLRPRALNDKVPRDLETIALKAMAKESHRRYASAKEMADDLRRWLAGEPILARPVGAMERGWRWCRRKPTAAALVFTLIISVTAATGALSWYQYHTSQRAIEEALRKSDAERKQALAEEKVRQGLDQARKTRDELQKILKKPGGVHELLNQTARWEALINSARAEWQRANDHVEAGGDSQWTSQLLALDQELMRDQADYDLAVRLEKIRMDQVIFVEGRFDHTRATEDYRQAFAIGNLAVLDDTPAAMAARIIESPIKEQLVAALDNWAWAAFGHRKEGNAKHLMEIGRIAAPDPAWGDRVRRIGVWRDQQALTKIANEAPAAGLSPQMLQLFGNLLSKGHPLEESWQRQARARFPADLWLNYDLGNAIRKTNPVEAAGFYHVALAVRPGSSLVYNGLGLALGGQKKLPEAIAAYQKAIELDRTCAPAYYNLGVALREQKMLPEALAALQTAINFAPNYAMSYNNLGNVLHDQKKMPQAIAAYQKAIELDPKCAHAYNNLGIALRERKKLTEAIAALNKAISFAPDYATAYNELGIALHEQKNEPEAIAAYQKAIELDPKFAAPHVNLGIVFSNQNKLPSAMRAYQKAIELDPKLAAAHYSLGNAFVKQQKVPEAVAAFQKAVEVDPRFPAYHNLGNALYALKKLPEAVPAYQKAIDLDPQSAISYYGLGIVLRAQYKLPEAIATYRKSINLDPQNAKVYNDLGEALYGQKDLPAAIGALQKALAIDPMYSFARSNLNVAQKALALDRKLPVVLNGGAASFTDLLDLAVFSADYKERYQDAVKLYARAFAIQPTLVEQPSNPHRYNAACFGALAAAGKGSDSNKLDAKAKAGLREQSLGWLQADLSAHAKSFEERPIQTFQQMQQWQRDPQLAPNGFLAADG